MESKTRRAIESKAKAKPARQLLSGHSLLFSRRVIILPKKSTLSWP